MKRPLLFGAIAAATLLVATGCSTGGDGGSDEAGVEYGATMEEYQAAFEDVDPITLRMQVDMPKDSDGNRGREAYAAALEEWSGGKITVEIGYANAFVPNAADWAPALSDGRLDIAWMIPS